MRHLTLTALMAVAVLAATSLRAADEDAKELARKLGDGSAAERDEAEQKIRKLGVAAIPALRDAKPEKEEGLSRVRNTLTDMALDASKMVPEDAALLHELAREEGKGKRYTNSERLYRRAEQLYDQLKDDADRRKDKTKEKEYSDKRRVCDRMKDKAGHKAKGDSHTGVNLGFVRVGKDHDMSDEWE